MKENKREKSRNWNEERKKKTWFENGERIVRVKGYRRPTDTKSQMKRRRRNRSKDYKRKRNLNGKVYPKRGVEENYQRPKRKRERYKDKSMG